MEPGKKLDRLIGKVMNFKPELIQIATNDGGKSAAITIDSFSDTNGLRDWIEEHKGYELGVWEYYKPYSTDISAAWEVVKKMKDFSEVISISWCRGQNGGWQVSFEDESVFFGDAPYAICLAALKAVEKREVA